METLFIKINTNYFPFMQWVFSQSSVLPPAVIVQCSENRGEGNVERRGRRIQRKPLPSFFSKSEESVNAQVNMATCLWNAVSRATNRVRNPLKSFHWVIPNVQTKSSLEKLPPWVGIQLSSAASGQNKIKPAPDHTASLRSGLSEPWFSAFFRTQWHHVAAKRGSNRQLALFKVWTIHFV